MRQTTILRWTFAFTLLAVSVSLLAEDRKANEMLQAGLTKETVQGDLKGAIELYEKAAKEAGANRALAAKAQLRLGAAYQKQGNEQARAVFQRITSQYADQADVVAEARSRLRAMGEARPPDLITTESFSIGRAGSDQSISRGIQYGQQRQITLLDRQGKVLGTVGDLGPVGVGTGAMTISPDGKRVAWDRGGFINVYDVAKKSVVRLTSGPGNAQPAWSPDGSRIAFQSYTGGSGVYVIPSNGAGKQELVYSPLSGDGFTLVRWSPDGRFLTFQVREPGFGYDLWVLSLTGDKKPVLVLRTPAAETGPGISPDGRYLSYRSNESGKSEVYVRPFNPGGDPVPSSTAEKWQVSAGKGIATAGAYWRADGKEMYYISADGEVMAVDVTTTPTFKAGTPRVLFQVPAAYKAAPNNTAGYYSVTADGKTFAFLVPR